MGLRSDAGLLAEEYNPKTNGLMGSFPQPFSPAALETMAVDISRQKGPAVRRSRSGASHKPIPVVVLGRQWIVFGTRQNDERNNPRCFFGSVRESGLSTRDAPRQLLTATTSNFSRFASAI